MTVPACRLWMVGAALALTVLAGCRHSPSLCHRETSYSLLDSGEIVLENPEPAIGRLATNAARRGHYLVVAATDPNRRLVLDRIVAIAPSFLEDRQWRVREYGPCG